MQVDTVNNYTQAMDLFSIINGNVSRTANIFDTIQEINNQIAQKFTPQDEIIRDPMFINMYFQYPNEIIENMAMKIVDPNDSDDLKMRKIQYWVVKNIAYEEDKKQYGYDELWVPPVMLLRTRKGDCEDGAFLIMSLALNAGVNPNRLKLYGGVVKAGEGAQTGGHAWVAYQRETDNEWIPIDFSYYPTFSPLSLRTPLKDDENYIDDYFVMDMSKIIITEYTNRVRNPDLYDFTGYVKPNVLLPGTWVSLFA